MREPTRKVSVLLLVRHHDEIRERTKKSGMSMSAYLAEIIEADLTKGDSSLADVIESHDAWRKAVTAMEANPTYESGVAEEQAFSRYMRVRDAHFQKRREVAQAFVSAGGFEVDYRIPTQQMGLDPERKV